MDTVSKVLAIHEIDSDIDSEDIPSNGIVSCVVIPYSELDDETLEILFSQRPDWVMEKRSDWVKEHYPNLIH